jgi:hypothetical protein
LEIGANSQLNSISDIKNRADLVRFFENAMTTSAKSLKENQRFVSGTNLVKSFIVESNLESSDLLSRVSDEIKLEEKSTHDKNLTLLTLSLKKNKKKNSKYILDSANKRFLVFHTLEKSDTSRSLMRHLVKNSFSRLDNIWLSRDFLTNFISNRPLTEFSAGFETDIPDYLSEEELISGMSIRVWGTASQKALNTLKQSTLRNTVALRAVRARFLLDADDDQQYADERIAYSGILAASGTSSVIHFQTVANVIKRYEAELMIIEKKLTGAESIRDVSPQFLKVSTEITNIRDFVEILYTNMHRLRIFGIPTKVTSDYYRIPAIDLHNGDKLDLEINKNGIRVFLWPGSCGNTLLRLEARLQKYVNAEVVRSDAADA